MRAASQLKSTKLAQDKKLFDTLPEYCKIGLYCSNMFENVRKQCFTVKKSAYESLKYTALEKLTEENYIEAHYRFSRVN